MRSPRCITLLLALLGICTFPASAWASFDDGVPRFSQTARGNITMAANTLMTCSSTILSCLSAQQTSPGAIKAGMGGYFNNNYFAMKNVDRDSYGSTSNSSLASLALPKGSKVLWAGLYWSATPPTGMTATQAKAIQLRPPGASTSYQALTASTYNAATGGMGYSSFVDVTDIVKQYGAGSYTVGGAATKPLSAKETGTAGVGAGWAIVVAYEDPAQPLKNLSVFDGKSSVSSGGVKSATISVKGFKTPPTGTVKTELGFVAFEGDRGTTGDSVKIDGSTVSDAMSPASNFFDSAISLYGSTVKSRTPNYSNQLGYDAKIVRADGKLKNNSSSTSVVIATSSDGYQLNALSFATELYAANLQTTHTVQDLNGGQVRAGDILRYTVGVKNTGSDKSTQNIFSLNSLPLNTEYVPNSLRYNSSSVSDAAGDDRGDFQAGKLSVRLGATDDPSLGGEIPVGPDQYTISYDLKVSSLPNNGTIIASAPVLSYYSPVLDKSISSLVTEASIMVKRPDLSISGSITSTQFTTGQPAQYQFIIKNSGDSASEGSIQFTDQLPAGVTNTPVASGVGWDCLPVVSGLVRCSRSDALNPGASYTPITVSVGSVSAASGVNISNTGSVNGSLDGNSANNQTTIDRTVGVGSSAFSANLVLDPKSVVGGQVPTGKPVLVTAQFSNIGSSAAQSPQLTIDSDLNNPLLQITSFEVNSSKGSVLSSSCHITQSTGKAPSLACTPTSIAAGEMVQVKIYYQIDPATSASAVLLTSTAQATNLAGAPIKSNATLNIQPADTSVELSIDGSITSEYLATGVPAQYTLTVSNTGTDPSSGKIEVTDQLPAGLTQGATVSGIGWSCDPVTSGLVHCWRTDSLAVDGSYPDLIIDIPQVQAAAGSSPAHSATLKYPDGTGDTATADVDLTETVADGSSVTATDLELTGDSEPADGETVTQEGSLLYSWTIDNAGDNPSQGAVDFKLTLPIELKDAAQVSGDGWTCDPVATDPLSITKALVHCSRSDVLAAGESYPNILVNVSSMPKTVSGTIMASAQLVNQADNDQTDNQVDITHQVVPAASLTTVLSLSGSSDPESPDPIVYGDPLTYVWTVSNEGDNPSQGELVFQSTVPAQLKDLAQVSGNGWTCDPITLDPKDANKALIQCKRSDALTAGDDYPDITVTIPAVPVTLSGQVASSASISNALDSSPNDNQITISNQVEPMTTNLSLDGVSDPTDNIANGSAVQYTWTVSNDGDHPSQGKTVFTSQLPEGFRTGATVSGSNWSCDPIVNGLIHCERSDALDPGTPYPSITVSIPSASGAENQDVTVRGSIANAFDNDETDDQSEVVLTVDPSSTSTDLGIDGALTSEQLANGKPAQYTWTVSNEGENTSTGAVTVTNQLPVGLNTGASASGDGWTCSPVVNGLVSCTRSDPLEADDSYPDLVVDIPSVSAAAGQEITNTATLTNAADNDSTNNRVDVTETVEAGSGSKADFEISGEITSDRFVNKGEAEYTWTIQNSGDVPSSSKLDFTSQLPAGLKDGVTVSGDGWSCDPMSKDPKNTKYGLVHCWRSDSLESDDSYDPIVVSIPSVKNPAGSAVVVEANIRSSEDSNTSNNKSTVSRIVESDAENATDLVLSGSATSPSFANGLPAQYTWSVKNNGDNPSSGKVEFNSRLPVGLRNILAVQAVGWTCDSIITDSRNINYGTVHCWRSTALASGQSYSPIIVNIKSVSTKAGNKVTTTAQITNSADNDTSNNQALVEKTVDPGSSIISARIKADRTSIAAGEELRTVSQFTNTGASDANGLRLEVKSNLTGADLTATGFSVASSRGSLAAKDCMKVQSEDTQPVVECQSSQLLSGENAQIVVYYRPSPTLSNTTLNITANSSADNFVKSPSTDIASVQVQFSTISRPQTPYVDLQSTQIIGSDTLKMGENVEITSHVTNNGSASSGAISLSSTLPSGLDFVKAQWKDQAGTSGTCTGALGIITCSKLPSLSSGSSNNYLDLVVTGRAGLKLGGPQISSATASSSATDINPYNNMSSAGFMASPWSRASLIAQAPGLVRIGKSLIYRFTANNIGPSAIKSARVVISLGRGVHLAQKISGCSESRGIAICQLGAMQVSSKKVMQVPLRVPRKIKPGYYTMGRAWLSADSPISMQTRTNILQATVRR